VGGTLQIPARGRSVDRAPVVVEGSRAFASALGSDQASPRRVSGIA